jgi:IS5 family transposase
MQGSSRNDQAFLDAAVLCGHLLGEGSVHAFLAEHRTRLFPDEMFADLFPTGRGRPSVPADVIATVMVLQALEGLSDREACRALQTNIAWKAACGLSLTDEAFHPTVLTLWRAKLRVSDRPQRIFDAVRDVVRLSGVIAGKYRRALDSTVLDDAVARQDTITMIVAQMRRVRKLVPELHGIFVHEENLAGGRPPADYEDRADIDRLVSVLVEDANELVFAAEELDLDETQADAVALLALVAGQDVEPTDRPGHWKIARRTAPDRVVSVVDPESRHVHKTTHSYRDGYKAHVAVEPDTGLITATHLEKEKMTAVIKPGPLRTAVPGGYNIDDFVIDSHAATVTCPEGVTVAITKSRTARFGANCASCPMRYLCTKATGGRVIKLHPHHDLLVTARVTARTDAFLETYRHDRPMVERSLAWLVRKNGRRLAYRGSIRNAMWLAHRAAAVNLMRMVNLGLTFDERGWTMAAE